MNFKFEQEEKFEFLIEMKIPCQRRNKKKKKNIFSEKINKHRKSNIKVIFIEYKLIRNIELAWFKKLKVNQHSLISSLVPEGRTVFPRAKNYSGKLASQRITNVETRDIRRIKT